MGIAEGGDGAVAGFDGAGEPVVEIAPAAAGFDVFFLVVRGGVPEGFGFRRWIRVRRAIGRGRRRRCAAIG